MASLISETMRCDACNHTYFDLLERSNRDDTYACPECRTLAAKRTWSTPHVSTEKLSQTLPDVVGTGRFDSLKQQQALKKERAHSREVGDRTSERKIDKELKKVNK